MNLTDQQANTIIETFHRDGIAVVRGVLSRDEAKAICDIADQLIDDPKHAGTPYIDQVMTSTVLRYTQSLHRVFVDLISREPIVGLAEKVVGGNSRFCGQNVIRSGRSEGITRWHVDDVLEFPLPDEIPRFDPRIRMPVTWLSVQIALSDIDALEHGPTQYVPGSHYSGRHPPQDVENPVFEGREPVPILCNAGDIYLFNHQTWHRGAPNLSGRMRYLMQNQYSARWTATRFNLKANQCNLPEEQLRGADERALKILGMTGANASRAY